MKKLSSNSFKVSVAPESGADATTYFLVPSATQIKRKADGTHLPTYVSCESLSKTGDGIPITGIGTIKFILTYKTGSTSAEFLYASRIIITSDMAGISFRLYIGGRLLDEKTVLIVDDGAEGLPGPAGGRGRLPFPSGTFDKATIYTCTDDITPIVYYEAGNTYYVMRKNGNSVGIDPAYDYANNPDSKWIPFENYQAIFTEILMANFAKLASAVFYGDYMFSQQGIDISGAFTTDYKEFNNNDPYAISNSFRPSICLNFKTGDVYAGSGKIKLAADGSGHVANENFKWTKEGRIVGTIIPDNYVVTILPNHLANFDHSLVITNILNRTIVFTSNNLPICSRLKIAMDIAALYDLDVPSGKILGNIELINNSTCMLTISINRITTNLNGDFYFSQGYQNGGVDYHVGYRVPTVKLKPGGFLKAHITRNTPYLTSSEIYFNVLNQSDFEQATADRIENGVILVEARDVVNKGLSVSII